MDFTGSPLIAAVSDVLAVTPAPARPVIATTAAIAVVAVLYRPTWGVLRHAVTIAHEGGHAATAALTGRRLQGVRLHSDTSGLTVSSGRPTGLGVVLTLLAGYIAPSLLGLAAAFALAAGRAVPVLWVAATLLVALLLLIRNLFGVLSIVITGGAIVAVAVWAPPWWQGPAAYLLTWFLLAAGPRPVLELQRSRRQGRAPMSDADQLARLTRVPGLVWVTVFLAVTMGCLALGTRLLIV